MDSSVAICTHDRPQQLRRALASILAQSPRPAEIIVVDNAPSDSQTRDLVMKEFSEVRYVVEPLRGLDFARNRALDASTREIVAYLDDDAVAATDWVARIEEAFRQNPSLGATTGRIEPLDLDTPGQRLFQADGGLDRGKSGRLLFPRDAHLLFRRFKAPNFLCAITAGAGCNLAVKRETALALGGFDEALGVGTMLPGGDENDLLWRLLDRGFEVLYEPNAVVYHEHRKDVDEAVDQLAGYQLAMVALLTKIVRQSRGQERWSALAFLLWRLLKPGYRLLRRGFGRDPLPAGALLTLWASCWRGLTAYPASLRATERLRQERS